MSNVHIIWQISTQICRLRSLFCSCERDLIINYPRRDLGAYKKVKIWGDVIFQNDLFTK